MSIINRMEVKVIKRMSIINRMEVKVIIFHTKR